MNKVAAFALRRKNSILSMSEKMFCPPQPLRFWITPAYAGKRCRSPAFRSMPWDHPRLCGKSAGTGSRSGASWDHPRMCGEKTTTRSIHSRGTGSPPRVRGKAASGLHVDVYGRITPAYAGKRCSARTPTFRTWDHPRLCGEKLVEAGRISQEEGSPPRVRGKGLEKLAHERRRGITPACAGKRMLLGKHDRLCGDHPRVCGEKGHGSELRGRQVGSPPHVRGKGVVSPQAEAVDGITPACAGKRAPGCR